MEYGIEFWSRNTYKEGLEKAQGMALESITNQNNTVYEKLGQELGLHTIKTNKEKRQLAFKFKLETMNKTRIPSKIYNMGWHGLQQEEKKSSFKSKMSKLAARYNLKRTPELILIEEAKTETSQQVPPQQRARDKWKKLVKQAVKARYTKVSLKPHALNQTTANKLKLKLVTGKKTRTKCKICKKPATFKHFCLICPKMQEKRTNLCENLRCNKVTENMLLYAKHGPRDKLRIDKFLVEVSNLLQPLVALPPLPGARPMPISGRVQVD